MQSSVSSRFVEIVFILSDMLNEVDKPFWYDAIIANLPQTPFRLAHSRLDRNGGPDSLKYHRILLEEFHKRKDKQLVLLYSSMAWPAKYR